MTDPVQLALVGLGRMGSVHAHAIATLDAFDVVAVADPSADARAAAALLFPRARLLAEPADVPAEEVLA
jgi:predicted dehydrogenase